MISQTARYALRTIGFLADHRGQRVSGSQIASATGIPANYLSKILNQLRKSGLVQSQKGWGGGFLLREDKISVPINEVLGAIDEAPETSECMFELRSCDANNPCPLHGHWERIRGELTNMLQHVRIGDLASEARREGKPHFFW
jgi:Rrf2 family transcriptional regulator, iron-sulfur cluster assembly transcription factor